MQQASIVAEGNETRDNDSDETEVFAASVVLRSGKNFHFITHQVPNYN